LKKELLIPATKAFFPIALLIGLQWVDIKELGLSHIIELLFAVSFSFCVFFVLYLRTLILKADNRNEKVDMGDETTGRIKKEDADVKTVEQHDRSVLVKQMMELVAFSAVTYYTKAPTAMVMQTVTMPWRMVDSNLTKIYIWKMEAKGPLQRPWGSLFSASEAQFKKSVTDAKKGK